MRGDERRECFGCVHLRSQADGAGGGLYLCAMVPGLVRGAWGHWTDDTDVPREVRAGCWRPRAVEAESIGRSERENDDGG